MKYASRMKCTEDIKHTVDVCYPNSFDNDIFRPYPGILINILSIIVLYEDTDELNEQHGK